MYRTCCDTEERKFAAMFTARVYARACTQPITSKALKTTSNARKKTVRYVNFICINYFELQGFSYSQYPRGSYNVVSASLQ